MIQCSECEFFQRSESGEISFRCDPFSTIKEPQCLQKWQLIKINQMVSGYQATLKYYQKLAPMQEKMFSFMEQEMDGMNEADKWKIDDDDDDDRDDDDDWGDGDELF